MTRISGQFWELVGRQYGAIARWQLVELGFTDAMIAHRLGRSLFRVHQGVYAVGRPELSERGRWMAAVLAGGPGAALSHESGGQHWRVFDAPVDRIHISVPPGRHPHHPGLAIHRRAVMPPVVDHEGIPAIDVLFTLVDLSRSRKPWQIEAIVNSADKLGLIAFEDAFDQLATIRRRPGMRKLSQVLAAYRVTDSDLERRFLRVAADAGLRPPLTQAVVCGLRVDFYWPDLGLVVETDGLTYHRTPAQQAKDRIRDQTLTAAGLTCLRFTNVQVRRRPNDVIRTLRSVSARLRSVPVHFAA
jgi:very-short-patch-repair endonuclease